jgi:hypothetical protein
LASAEFVGEGPGNVIRLDLVGDGQRVLGPVFKASGRLLAW